jgi:hypothetical protein
MTLKALRNYAVPALACLVALGAWQGVGQAAEKSKEQQLMTSRSARESIGIYNYLKVMPKTDEVEFTYGSAVRRRMSLDQFVEFVKARIIDQTVTSRPASFGYQIEYYSADGHAYLWYPGNLTTNIGTYVVRKSLDPIFMVSMGPPGAVVCFDYGPTSHNPSTGQTGGEECTPAYGFLAQIRGKRQGDVFGLTSGNLPFVMDKDKFPAWPDGKPLLDERAPHG